ncbi:MAG: YihY/virulence factor BrkB family protein [Myxococcota bacterium]
MTWLGRLFRFLRRIFGNFRKNNGLLLAGALGYNALLSMIPLFALILVVLSAVFDEDQLMATLAAQAQTILPGRAEDLTAAFSAFLGQKQVVGTVGLGAMLIFSSLAFRMLEDAMATVFRRDRAAHDRRWWISAILPLAYVSVMAFAIFVLTAVMVAFDTLPAEGIIVLGTRIGGPELSVPLVKLLGFAGLVLVLSSFYWVLPQVNVKLRRAFVGGAVAAVLWEAARSVLAWYFANLSLVEVIYGSLATVVVLLLSLEVAAIIVLIGAEVIAELERNDLVGLPWYDVPRPGESHASMALQISRDG